MSSSPAIRKPRRPRASTCRRGGGLHEALIEVADLRFNLFRARFGRDPEMDETLFFDPACDQPTVPTDEELLRQLAAAAKSRGVSLRLLQQFFGLEDLDNKTGTTS